MVFLQNAAITFLIFANMIVSGVLGFFHLPQPYVAQSHQASATTTQEPSASSYLNMNGFSSTSQVNATILPPGSPTTVSGIIAWLPIEATSSSYFTVNGDQVYAQGNAILDADPSSFSILFSTDDQILLARDAQHIFSADGGSVLRIDSQTFSVVGYSTDYGILYGKDKSHAYWFTGQGWGIVQDADPNTLTTTALMLPYAKDSARVYFTDTAVAGADPLTFSSFPLSGYAKDKNHVFSHFGYGSYVKIVQGADPLTFFPYPARYDLGNGQPDFSYYGRDDRAIYCQASELSSANLATFAPTDSIDAKDKYHAYIGCALYNNSTSAP
jgi:hypothetical protein